MKTRASQQGFSLVELLVVLGVVAILAGLTAPSIISSMRGSTLNQGAQKVTNELMVARQTALARNHAVEVRFYQIAKAGSAGETAGSPATGKFRAMQSFIFDDAGNATAIDKVQWLPDGIIIDAGGTLSTLFNTSLDPTMKKTWGAAGGPPISLPTVGTAYNALAFQFLPDGSTNLKLIAQQWFLTLHSLSLGDNLAALPKNFFMLQIDPLNGHVQNYRP